MTDENDKETEIRNRREQRAMWIFSLAVVVLIAGAMGANVLFHHEKTPTDISSQSRPTPDK